ncbi:TolC family protein [Portibacter marinus]|uniref:TolC family protein n=1 Tax=Portibacter marinus TaxID=2898660 RepID=UPI001F3DC4D4|nr:TolC family protein [Portibacter marinus]
MKSILYSILFLTGLYVNGQEVMTLPKAIAIGLENNFQISIDEKSILIAENNNTWARAGKLPTIDLTANFNNTITQDNNPASFLRGEFYNGSLSANLGINWVVYAGGRVQIVKDQLDLAVTQQQLNKQSGIHELMRNIYQDYHEVLFQKERLLVLQSTLNLSKVRLAYEETRRDFGATNSFNLIQFQNAVLSDSINLVNQDQQVEIAKRNLYNTLNIIGFANYIFPERLQLQDEEIRLEALQEVLQEENYTLKSLQLIADLDRLNTQIERTSMLPTVSVSASVGAAENAFKIFAENPMTGEPYDLLFSNRLNGSAGASASWRLYDGGIRKDNIASAIIQEDIDRLSIEQAVATIGNQLEILVDNYNNQRRILKLSDDQIALAERNLTITEERFKGGLISSIDFRNVQNQYINAAFAKVNAIYSIIVTKSEIDFLVGKFE